MSNRRNKLQDYENYIDFLFLNKRCCAKSVFWMLPMPLRCTERTALMRLQVCVFGVKSANRDERLSRLTLKGVEK